MAKRHNPPPRKLKPKASFLTEAEITGKCSKCKKRTPHGPRLNVDELTDTFVQVYDSCLVCQTVNGIHTFKVDYTSGL